MKRVSAILRIHELRIFKFFLFLLPSAILPLTSFSQPTSYTKYWIQFTDKNNNPYSISNPSAYLSARAILRRTNQGIAIVQNDLPITPAYIDSVRKVPNVTVLNHSKWFNAVTISTTDTIALQTIQAFPFVKKTEPVKRLCRNSEGEEYATENAEYRKKYPFINKIKSQKNNSQNQIRNSQSAFSSAYNYGLSFNQVDMLGGVCMHDMGYDGKGMVIAILDVGFDHVDSAAAFDSLRANNQILGRWNFVNGDSIVTVPGEVHGTWCLSLMAGNIPGQLIGTAPKAKYWLLVTEDGPTENVIEEDNWVCGAEFADSVGADVLSTSLGYTEFDSVKINNITVVNPANHKRSDMDGKHARISIASAIAASKGILPVCAAGNMGGSTWHFIGAPADADSALAVGAVDSMKNYVWFSSKGPSYDGRVKPNVAAQGDHPYTTDLAGGTYNLYSGTSFACPLTAGMVACLWQAHPNATNMQLYNVIQQTASQNMNPDTLLGYGIPDFCFAHSALSSVHENNLAEDIKIFPNPSKGKFIIDNGKLSIVNCQLSIINVLGEKIYLSQLNSTKSEIDLSKQPSGVYFLQLKTEQGIATKKIVISK